MTDHLPPGLPGPTTCLVALILLAGWASPGSAQPRPGAEPEGRVLEVGPRIGFDYRDNVLVLGAQLRLPVDPWYRLEFVPSMDFTFHSGLTERQYNLDGAIYLDSGRSVYVGGGAAFRNTFFEIGEGGELLGERETRTGYSLFGGFHGGSVAGTLVTQVEFRWSFVDRFEPQSVSVGLNYPIPLGF